MIQNLNANQHILELQQKQMMMMGQLNTKQGRLTDKEIETMKTNYVGMYYGFVSVNWGQNMTLGMAWQKALEQMDAFVASKMKVPNHPANKEFLKFHKDWRHKMAESIMTSDYANEKLKPEFRKEFLEYGTKCIKEKKKALNDLYEKYMPKQELQKTKDLKSFDIAKQKVQQQMQQMLLMQNMYQRAA